VTGSLIQRSPHAHLYALLLAVLLAVLLLLLSGDTAALSALAA
jgi:hypothetical protein